MPSDTNAESCEGCGAARREAPLRNILMVGGERELLCESCFESALDDHRVSTLDPRLPGENA